MKNVTAIFAAVVFAAVIMCTSGCASYRTISTAERGTPLVFSGTRLNAYSITGNDSALKKFKTEPPSYPWLDLPFSFFADAMVFHLTASFALYDALFE